VNDDAAEMMQTRVYAERLAVEHVRQGGDGIPIGGVKMSEGPCMLEKLIRLVTRPER